MNLFYGHILTLIQMFREGMLSGPHKMCSEYWLTAYGKAVLEGLDN